MAWRAVEELDSALDATKLLLLPFALKRWLVLATVVFFIGATSGVQLPSLRVDLTDPRPGEPSPPWEPPWRDPWIEPIDEGLALQAEVIGTVTAGDVAIVGSPPFTAVFVLIGFALLLGLAFAYIGAVMEFVFVEIARSRDVRIRGFFGSHTRNGLALFLLRVGVGVTILAGMLASLLLALLLGWAFLLVLVLLSPALLLIGIGTWVLLRFTVDFVVPVMIGQNVGLLEGWRQFWPELRGKWKQYGVYAAIRLLFGAVTGVVVGIGFATIALIVGIPFALVGLLGLFLLVAVAGLEILGVIWAVGLLLLFGLTTVVVGTTAVAVPVQTYLRYYALLVLGSISPDFELLADIRADLPDGTSM